MPVEQDFYTEEEKALLREQLKRGNADARAELERRGVTLHPRVAALKAAGKWPEPEPVPPGDMPFTGT